MKAKEMVLILVSRDRTGLVDELKMMMETAVE